MKQVFWFFGTAFFYVTVAGVGWSWALGLEFPVWKLLVVGALHGVATLTLNRTMKWLDYATADKVDGDVPNVKYPS